MRIPQSDDDDAFLTPTTPFDSFFCSTIFDHAPEPDKRKARDRRGERDYTTPIIKDASRTIRRVVQYVSPLRSNPQQVCSVKTNWAPIAMSFFVCISPHHTQPLYLCLLRCHRPFKLFFSILIFIGWCEFGRIRRKSRHAAFMVGAISHARMDSAAKKWTELCKCCGDFRLAFEPGMYSRIDDVVTSPDRMALIIERVV